MNMKLLPPAAKNLFEKRFLDFQKLFINKKLLCGVQGGGFLEKSPPGRRRQKRGK
jgi:hypothetical protein